MALIKCHDCGKMISDKAERCIGCGCPMEHILGQAEKTIQAVGTEKEYIYCSVSFALDYQSSRTYWFISDEEVKVGDHAIVCAGYENEEKEVVIKEVRIIKDGQIPPYPVNQTKRLEKVIKKQPKVKYSDLDYEPDDGWSADIFDYDEDGVPYDAYPDSDDYDDGGGADFGYLEDYDEEY